jgi:competence protein ComFC
VNTTKLKQTGVFVLQSLNHLFWPAVCISCGDSICDADKGLCQNCWDELSFYAGDEYCPRCGKEASRYALVNGTCPDCQGKEFHFDRIARSGFYKVGEALQKMIVAFKNGRTELDLTLAFLANSALQASSFYKDIEIFVPVPLHWSRRFMRGYNQSLIIAKNLNRSKAGISTELVRIRQTKFQTDFDDYKTWQAKRAANVAGAFAIRRGHPFAGKVICLVDDIKTTGATLNECAKTLKEAGAAKVFALVLAVAGQNTG